MTELGFVGCLLDPDPFEGEGDPPGLGEEYWYPLYDKLRQLDVPAMIHSASCSSPRESYSLHFINEESIAVLGLVGSKVFADFPTLKVVVAHGGGAIPYQIGRFRSPGLRRGDSRGFPRQAPSAALRHLHSEEGLELLFKVVGLANCLFGTERPGTGGGSIRRPVEALDDLRPVVEGSTFCRTATAVSCSRTTRAASTGALSPTTGGRLMAEIVIGLGTSHGSQVSLTPDWWEARRARSQAHALRRATRRRPRARRAGA